VSQSIAVGDDIWLEPWGWYAQVRTISLEKADGDNPEMMYITVSLPFEKAF
jgi:hypothetical protein